MPFIDIGSMARPLRIEYEGAYYHVTSRGNERKAVFREEKDWGQIFTVDIRNEFGVSTLDSYKWLR
jgi:hypothetical protein